MYCKDDILRMEINEHAVSEAEVAAKTAKGESRLPRYCRPLLTAVGIAVYVA